MHSRKPLIALEGIGANLLFGALFIWSVLRNPLLELFPSWSEGMLSIIFGIHNFFVCAGIFIGGLLSAKISKRRIFTLFLIFDVIGLGGFALLPVQHPTLSYVMAFILFCGFAATGTGFGISSVQSSTIPWFPKNSGMISGALYMALGISSVFLTALTNKILPTLGVKMTMLVFAGIVLVIAGAILLDRNSVAPPAEEAHDDSKPVTGKTPKEMLTSPVFWLLIVWNIGLRAAGLTLLDHAASIAAAYGGTVIIAMFIAPANGLGSFGFGSAMDRLGIRKLMVLTSVILAGAGVMLVGGCLKGAYAIILAGILVGGLAYGGSSSCYAAAVKNIFGSRYYSRNFGYSNIAMGCAALIESTSGYVLDAGNGSYTGVMVMVLCLTLPALACSVAIGPFLKKFK